MTEFRSVYSDFRIILDDLAATKEQLSKPNALKKLKLNEVTGLKGPRGLIPLHTEALRKFGDVARLALANAPDLALRVDIGCVLHVIKKRFETAFLFDEAELTEELAGEIVKASILEIRTEHLTTIRFFYSSIFLDDPNASSFHVGPVRFTRTTELLQQRKPELEEYIRQSPDQWLAARRKLKPETPDLTPETRVNEERKAEEFVGEMTAYYEQFPWVADIEVNQHEKERAESVASLCLDAALRILQLFLGPQEAKHVQRGDDPQCSTKGAKLSQCAGRLHISVSTRWPYHGQKGWVDSFTSGDRGIWLARGGSLINCLLAGEPIHPLYQRYLNALWWYGESFRQHAIPQLRIISLCNALEAVLATGRFIQDKISRRGAILLEIQEPGEPWARKLRVLYKMRSDLVHGRRPAFDPEVDGQVWVGSKMVHLILIEALSWTFYLAHTGMPATVDAIEERFDADLKKFAQGEIGAV